ncbi:MAG: LysE family translocator [Rhodocyclaceae bacterium]|nr:LysE family translocator [Rhodocyclaceae bacterium]
MPATHTLLAFISVNILLALAPGPDNLMVLGQSIARGARAGFLLALGCAAGCFTHTLWAALGISALVLASDAAFLLLKIAGALWLFWIGWQTLRSPALGSAPVRAEAHSDWKDFCRGFVANAVNPKVALFFLAFLPQFTDAARGAIGVQIVVLGCVFALNTILIFGAIAFCAGQLGALLARRPGVGLWMNLLAGVIFIALALNLLLAHAPR